MTTVQKNDFIQLEFVARIKETNEVFDTNIKEEAEKAKLDIKDFSPFIICVGKGMAIKGLDDALNGKEVGKEHSIEIKPEEAFGKRDSNMVKMIPLRAFIQQKVYPEKGMQLSLDGMIVKILSNSGGRVLVDFNNPIAGREVIYKFTIIKKIEEIKEKVNALQEFFFRKKFDFELKDKKIIFTVQKGLSKFLEAVSKPIEEILGLSIEIKETDIKEKTEDKTEKTFPKENSNK